MSTIRNVTASGLDMLALVFLAIGALLASAADSIESDEPEAVRR